MYLVICMNVCMHVDVHMHYMFVCPWSCACFFLSEAQSIVLYCACVSKKTAIDTSTGQFCCKIILAKY